jgi:hypothetical protein
MQNKVRVNLANPAELCEIPGVGREQADRILRFRAQHGPIQDASELCRVLGWPAVDAAAAACIDFTPAETTAPEAPGA